jgi:LytS/YehU family sensor histidine kinase
MVLTVVYTNFLLLIPKFFRQRRYILYSLFALLLVVAAVSLNTWLDQRNYGAAMKMSTRDMIIEGVFYVFNVCSYTLTSFLLYSLQEKQELKVEKLSTEIKYLRAQINPHFLFNTLNNIYGLSLEKSDKTPEVILKLSKIMDYMLYESNDVQVYLKKDIENIGNYIDIERIRQGNNAEITFEVKGEVTDQKIVPLVLLPLVENAFKHGVNTIIKGAYMRVLIVVNGRNLEIDVKNNFKQQETERNGIGLTNLEHRLRLFYENAHTMTTDSNGDEYHVNLKLRLS